MNGEHEWPVIEQDDETTPAPYFRRYRDGRIIRVTNDSMWGSRYVDSLPGDDAA